MLGVKSITRKGLYMGLLSGLLRGILGVKSIALQGIVYGTVLGVIKEDTKS